MELPFHAACVAGETLCADCQSKLGSGALSPMDLAVSKFMLANERKLALSEVRLAKCFDEGHIAVVVTDSEAGLLIGRKGRVAEALAEAIQRHVKVICRNDEVHVAVNELLRPVRALGINEIYAVGGKRAHKVRVAKKDAGHLPASREALAAVLDFLFSGNVQLSLE